MENKKLVSEKLIPMFELIESWKRFGNVQTKRAVRKAEKAFSILKIHFRQRKPIVANYLARSGFLNKLKGGTR